MKTLLEQVLENYEICESLFKLRENETGKDYYYEDDTISDTISEELKLFIEDIKCVHSYSEGDGNPMGSVCKIGDRYFEFSGYYSSRDSNQYQNCFEVFPSMQVEIKYLSEKQTQENLDLQIKTITEWQLS